MAQRVVRRVGLAPRAGRAPRSTTRRGPASPTPARTGPTGRTSCPRRTRSPPTTTTSRPSRSTSTASPTPRARRRSSSSSPGSARSEFFAGLRAYFAPARLRQHRVRRPARGARGDLRPRAGPVGRGVAADRRRQHADGRLRASTTTGRFTSFARAAVRAPGLPDAAAPPHRRRPLRPRRGRPRWSAARRVETDVTGARPRSPSWSASSSPTWCCSTTAT